MRSYFIAATFLATLMSLSACSPKIPLPDFRNRNFNISNVIPETPDAATCERKESAQPFPPEASASTMALEDTIASQDTQYVDCSGRVKATAPHRPVRAFHKITVISAPPVSLSGLTMVEIENFRNCSVNRIPLNAAEDLDNEIDLPDGSQFRLASLNSKLEASGEIRLTVTDIKSKLFSQTILSDGANVLRIRYFGAKSTLLAEKTLVIDLKVNRPNIDGIRHVDRCAGERR